MRAALAGALLLLVPLAAAQLPAPGLGGGEVEVAWTWTPGAVTAEQGSVIDMRATAAITLRGAVCAQQTTIVAEASLAPQPETVGLKTDPLALAATASVPPGAYAEPLGQPFSTTVEVPFRFLVDLDTTPGEYAMVVATRVAPPEGCAAAGAEASGGGAPPAGAFTVRVVATDTQLAAHPPHEEHSAGGFDLFLEPAAAKTFQFNATGRYTYHDHFRPELRAAILVEEQGPASAAVQVTAQGFNPAEVQVKVGGNVTWTNADRVGHTVSADELHPEHGALEEGEEGEPMDGGGNATAPGGNATAQVDSDPPRRSPGLEPLALGAGLGCAALLRRARRGDR